MLSAVVERELHQQLEVLPASQQRQVLDFARALAATQPQGVSGQALLSFAGTITLLDLAIMAQAAEDDCGQVNPQAGQARLPAPTQRHTIQ